MRQARHTGKNPDRRDFLRTSFSGAMLGTFGLTAFGSQNSVWAAESTAVRKWAMKLACSSIDFSRLPIEQAVERIAKLGFEAIDIWSAHAGCPHLDDVQNRLGSKGLMELLQKHNLQLYAFSVYRGGYAKYAKLLGECGGGVAVQGSGGRVAKGEIRTAMKKFFEDIKPLIALAEENQSYLAIENHGNALLDSVDSFKAFAEFCPSKHVGIALAPYHLQRLGASIPETIRIAGEHLFFIYMWQNAPGTAQLPGVGPTDVTPWIEALADIGYSYPVTPFMHHEPEPDEMAGLFEKSIAYLEECHLKALAVK